MIIVILGLPGAGKTYLAEKVAKAHNAFYLNIDKIKKQVNENSGDKNGKEETYEAMFSLMEKEATSGKNVVLDATFYRKSLRHHLVSLAHTIDTSLYFIEVVASLKSTRERLSNQRKYSSTDFKLYEKVKQDYEPLEVAHLSLRTDRLSITEMLRQVEEFIGSQEKK